MTKRVHSPYPRTFDNDTLEALINLDDMPGPDEADEVASAWVFDGDAEEQEGMARLAKRYRQANVPLEDRVAAMADTGQRYKGLRRQTRAALREALATIYTAVLQAYATDRVDELLADAVAAIRADAISANYQPTAASHPFLILARAHLGIGIKTASAYAHALRYTLSQEVKPDDLADFLKANGGVHGCAKRFTSRANRALGATSGEAPHNHGDTATGAPPALVWKDATQRRLAEACARGRRVVLVARLRVDRDGTLTVLSLKRRKKKAVAGA